MTTSLTDHMRDQRIAAEHARTHALPALIAAAEAVQADWTVPIANAEQLRIALTGGRLWCADQVAEVLGPIIDGAMRVRVEYRLDSGPAIYMEVPFFAHQTIAAHREGYARQTDRFTDEQRQAFAQRILDAGKQVDADERSVRQGPPGGPDVVWNATGDRPYEVRLWWD